MTLHHKVVIVTGSSRGIGRAVALAFAQRGAKVVVNSQADISGGRALANQIQDQGGIACYIQADVSEPEQVAQLFEQAEKSLGPVDVLVNNSGLTQPAQLHENTKEHWLHMLNVNLISTVLCSVRAAESMADRGGSIINTSSVRGLDGHGRAGILAYSAAKAGVNNFTKTFAQQCAPKIRVNAVAPGFTATSYLDRTSTELKQSWLSHIPLGEFINPADLANAYIYLAESDYLTGTILTADAGFTLGEA